MSKLSSHEKHITAKCLVSDDLEKNNDGVTLPGEQNATHNIYLPPFYINRGGQNYNLIVSWIPGITYRGTDSYLWSSSASDSGSAYRFYATNSKASLGIGVVHIRAIPLRCLVSTNNG